MRNSGAMLIYAKPRRHIIRYGIICRMRFLRALSPRRRRYVMSAKAHASALLPCFARYSVYAICIPCCPLKASHALLWLCCYARERRAVACAVLLRNRNGALGVSAMRRGVVYSAARKWRRWCDAMIRMICAKTPYGGNRQYGAMSLRGRQTYVVTRCAKDARLRRYTQRL